MEPHFFFFMGLAFILTHELDAVKQHEWRMFPLTFWLPERPGYLIFTALHVLLFTLLFLNLYGVNGVNRGLVKGLDIFFIVHVGLHLLFLAHPKNEFSSRFSWVLIGGAGLSGLVDLIVSF